MARLDANQTFDDAKRPILNYVETRTVTRRGKARVLSR